MWNIFLSGCTIIFLKQSSTVGAFWHSTEAVSSVTLLILHVSHFTVSAWPTAHHLMLEDSGPVLCSGEGSKQRPCVRHGWQSWKKCGSYYFYHYVFPPFTFPEGVDDAHIVSTQIQEGVCVWRNWHQSLCWILEHQILGGGVCLRGK